MSPSSSVSQADRCLCRKNKQLKQLKGLRKDASGGEGRIWKWYWEGQLSSWLLHPPPLPPSSSLSAFCWQWKLAGTSVLNFRFSFCKLFSSYLMSLGSSLIIMKTVVSPKVQEVFVLASQHRVGAGWGGTISRKNVRALYRNHPILIMLVK